MQAAATAETTKKVCGGPGCAARAALAEARVRAVPEPGTRANPLLDIAAVARRLGVSKKTVRRLIYERGAFPGWQRVESRIRVPEQDLLAYLRRQRSTPVPP
jgi:excisionase family DNA binding protein